MDLNKRLKRSTGGIGGSNTTRWFFVLPAMAIVICLLIYPLMSTLVYSFTNKTMTKTTFKVIGLTNYVNVLKDPAFFAAFGHSLLWTAGSVLGQVIVGFVGALSLNRIKNKKVQNAFRICAIIPSSTGSTISAWLPSSCSRRIISLCWRALPFSYNVIKLTSPFSSMAARSIPLRKFTY